MDITNSFDSIRLDEMTDVQLMRRSETKFVFHRGLLEELLQRVTDRYRILEINGQRALSYQTTYFDTPDNAMYLRHHNGCLNRYKIRFRRYLATDESFLEVKHKSNKGVTNKKRIQAIQTLNFTIADAAFIRSETPYLPNHLSPQLLNRFTRITLVNKTNPERVTIDFDLTFRKPDSDEIRTMAPVCIVEVKRNASNRHSDFKKILKQAHIYPVSFSKYCIGIALTYPQIKHNRFKMTLERIKKMEPGKFEPTIKYHHELYQSI